MKDVREYDDVRFYIGCDLYLFISVFVARCSLTTYFVLIEIEIIGKQNNVNRGKT